MMPTLREISMKTGISIATFSRVLNGSEKVSEKMKKKVYAALKQYKYQRTAMISNRIKSVVGIIVPDLRGYHYPELTLGIEEALLESGYEFFLANTKQELNKEIDIISELYERKADGIVLCTSDSDDEQIKHLMDSTIPVVGVDRKDSEIKIDSVSIDNYNSTKIAANYLYKCGHRDVLFVEGKEVVYSARLRKKAFMDMVMEKRDFHVHYEPGDFEPESGYLGVQNALKKGIKFTAAFFVDDWMAYGGMRALYEAGISVPQDVSVMGFDDAPLSKYTTPGLTTILQPRFELGYTAGQLIMNRISGKEKSKVKRKIMLNTELVIRETVKKINGA
jgi:LacI family transcriptional regulator